MDIPTLNRRIGWLLAGRLGLILGSGACLIGHCWPVYYRFRGGKGVSVAAMISLLLDWRLFLILAAIFFLMFAISRRVSVCSLACAVSFPIFYVLLGNPMDAGMALSIAIAVIVIFSHRSNIRRLLRGEEQPFVPKKKE